MQITVKDYVEAGGNARTLPKDSRYVVADDADGRYRSKYFSTAIHDAEPATPPAFAEFVACGKRRNHGEA